MALTSKLTAIGDAIRAKTGETDLLTLDAMAEAIADIETGGSSDKKVYDGDYIVIPSVSEQTLYTKNTLLTDNVEIQAIPYSETSNTSGGTTINIG